MVSIVASGVDFVIDLWIFHVFSMSAWASSKYFGFLPQNVREVNWKL